MERYEVCVTFWVSAENADDAALVIDNLISPDQDAQEEYDLDWSISSALEA